jgi:putative transcriptional regulator
MQKLKNQTSVVRKKTNSASSRRKSAVLSVLDGLESFSGASLIEATQVGLTALKSKKTLRTNRIEPPAPLDPKQIAEIRSLLNASQGVFASYLGVSKAAVVAWEYGVRQPSGAALKLLSIARKNPSVLIAA